jgi:hypothetical protein
MTTEITEQLTSLAFRQTFAFCYGCYVRCPDGHCPKCRSDDLMREYPAVGAEYGTDWVIKEILRRSLTPVDVESYFEDSLADCYPSSIQIGWIEVDLVYAIKTLDPLSFEMATQEYLDSLLEGDLVYSPDNGTTLYWTSDVECLIRESLDRSVSMEPASSHG